LPITTRVRGVTDDACELTSRSTFTGAGTYCTGARTSTGAGYRVVTCTEGDLDGSPEHGQHGRS
jgi:hypothetical protein